MTCSLAHHVTLVLSSMAIVGCNSASGLAEVMRGEGRLTLLEGFPNRRFEGELFEREKANPHRSIAGFPFYEEPLPISPTDATAVRSALSVGGGLETFSGEKKCGGFHPDYAVDVEKDGALWWVHIYFGCDEAQVIGPRGETRYDLARLTNETLENVLPPYRNNRPIPAEVSLELEHLP